MRRQVLRRVLATCGNPDNGRLGYSGGASDGTAFFRLVGGALAGEDVVSAAAGGAHTVALLSSSSTSTSSGGGAVLTFGDNARGQLGHSPASASVSTPVEALVPEEVVAVAAGDRHTLALGASGGVWAWGANGAGQCGLGAGAVGTDQPSPRLVPLLAGEWWGSASGASSSSSAHAPPPRIVALAAGGSHSAALGEDGSVFTWGAGSSGQLGHGGEAESSTLEPAPRRVRGLDGRGAVSSLVAGGDRTGAVVDGRVFVWGASGGVSGGQRRSAISTPTLTPSLHAVSALSLGRLHALAGRGLAGPAAAWGDGGDHGALGVGLTAAPGGVTPTPAPIMTAPDGGLGLHDPATAPAALPLIHLSAVAAGWQHSLGVGPDGDLFAWGWGGSQGGAFPFTPGVATGGGQLGLGDDNDRPAAGRVMRVLEGGGGAVGGAWRAVGVSAGVNHSVAVVEVSAGS